MTAHGTRRPGPRGSVVALVADLIFASRVRGTAERVGVPVAIVRSAEEVVERAKSLRPRLILIDLGARGADPVAAIARLKADRETDAIRIVAFVAHEDRAAIEAARSAGADRVMARSAFVRDLPALLGGGNARDG